MLTLAWSAYRQGTDPPAQERLQLAQEGVAAQRPARMRPQANPGDLFLGQPFGQRLAPGGGGELLVPPRQVQQVGAGPLIRVGRRTGPAIPPRPPAQPRPHGIELDLLQRQPQVPPVEGTGVEAPLPQVAATFVDAVDVLAVAKVGPPDRLGQRLLRVRDRHQVHVVGHQAVAQDLQAALARLLRQQSQVDVAVLIHEEHILTVVPALRDVVGAPDRNGFGEPWHEAILRPPTHPRQHNNR
jgi:hypothetical protein